MTDNLRQDASDKAESALKPDSQKSVLEQATDQAKSAADSVASTLQPEGDKSIGQKASDAVSGSGSEGKGLLEQAEEMVGNVIEQAKEALGYGEQSGGTGK